MHYDVIIIGGGLAGNSLALALKTSGLKLAIIEALPLDRLKNAPAADRALALAAGTAQGLQQINCWQGISHKATAIKHIHISDKGHFAKTRLSAQKNQVDALGYVITARDLEGHLLDLMAQTSIETFYNSQLTALQNNHECVTVTIKQNNTEKVLTAKLIVGADGGHSAVRDLLHITQSQYDYGQTALVTTVKASLPHHNVAFERFTAAGPLALLPINRYHSAVVWTRTHKDAQTLLTCSEITFINELQTCFGYKLGKLTVTAPRRAFALALIRANQLIAPRAVIIGNAAHQLHPVAGQGFNLGLRDVLCLAEYLMKTNQECGNAQLLKAYALARQKDHELTIQFTDKVVRLFSNHWLALAAVRSIGLLTLDNCPFAKTLLAKHAMGLAQKLTV